MQSGKGVEIDDIEKKIKEPEELELIEDNDPELGEEVEDNEDLEESEVDSDDEKEDEAEDEVEDEDLDSVSEVLPVDLDPEQTALIRTQLLSGMPKVKYGILIACAKVRNDQEAQDEYEAEMELEEEKITQTQIEMIMKAIEKGVKDGEIFKQQGIMIPSIWNEVFKKLAEVLDGEQDGDEIVAEGMGVDQAKVILTISKPGYARITVSYR